MGKMGRVLAYDTEGKRHEFEVYRTPSCYIVRLDGEELRRTGTHLDAIEAILEEAEARGYRRRR